MSESAISRIVNHAMAKVVDEGRVLLNNDLSRVQKVRFSGLPFCGVKWFLNLPSGLSKASYKDFGFAYFTSVGTTVHEVIQRTFLSVEDVELLMDWQCTKCKKRHVLVSERPDVCPDCGSTEHTHEEHELEFEGALGHIDQIIRFRFDGKTWIVVIDYKTTTIQATESREKLPYPSNVSQIKGYCGALKAKGHNVMGWALVYIPRDNPFRFCVKVGSMDEGDFKREAKWIRHYVSEHEDWMQVKTWKDIVQRAAERPCADKLLKRYSDCNHAERCAGDDVGCHAMLKEAFQKVHLKLPVASIKPTPKEVKHDGSDPTKQSRPPGVPEGKNKSTDKGLSKGSSKVRGTKASTASDFPEF